MKSRNGAGSVREYFTKTSVLDQAMTCRTHLLSKPRRRNSLGFRIVLILAILPLAACSLLQLTYNNLNWVIPWYVDDYIVLNNQQEALLDELIKQELRWHRKTQLPLYARFLRQLSRDLASLTPTKVDQQIADFEEFRKALMQQTATHLATLLETTSDSQLDDMFAKFAAYNKEFYETYIGQSAAKLQRNRLERMEGIFRSWLGPLTKTQRAAIDHWTRQRGSIAREVFTYRKQWLARFRTVLSYRDEAERFSKDLQLLFVKPHLYSPPTYLAKREQNITLGKELFLQIINAATPAQRERLQGTLDSYARDFEQLSLQT